MGEERQSELVQIQAASFRLQASGGGLEPDPEPEPEPDPLFCSPSGPLSPLVWMMDVPSPSTQLATTAKPRQVAMPPQK